MMTIEDIAKLANVSKTTVSLVLNNKSGVGPATRKRIWDVINEVGYTLQKRETSLSPHGNIRFVKYRDEGHMVNHNGDFISRVIDGIENSTRKAGMNLKITNVTSRNFDKMVAEINREDDDGIIFLGTEFRTENAAMLKRFRAPLVVVDNEMLNVNINAVVMDNALAVFTALKHLHDLGHRKIGHVTCSYDLDNLKSRQRGFQQAMSSFNLPLENKYIYTISPELKASGAMLLQQLNPDDLPTAILAANDLLALSTMQALKRLGKRIPTDISVTGIDDLIMSSVSTPELTTLKIHKKAMGEHAVERLIQMIQKKHSEVVKMLIGSEIVVRKSTAPPPT
ncbi:MAG: LacI family DNA-binding transcriptional regulator [Selenomonadaceae bacterium]